MSTKQGKTKPLSDKHQRFVAEYLVDLNATAAYKRAGYNATTRAATVNAARLLTNADIAAAIAAGQAKVLQKLELTAERVLQEVARIAFFDLRKMFDSEGNPIPVHKLDADTAAAINGLDVLEEFEGSGKDRVLIGHVKKYKIADKNAALGNALKVLGLLREKLEVTEVPVELDPVEGARRLAFALVRADKMTQPTVH
jgi:phage terminase small subunit